jgi:hypothetical protein
MKKYDDRHGGPWDRGNADAYYHRRFEPHYYVGNTGLSEKITSERMTSEEIEAYRAGYEEGLNEP